MALSFQDPKLTEMARDAPTLTREGRNSILQNIANMKWRLSSFDIKTAFLKGKANNSNPLAMEPPIELRKNWVSLISKFAVSLEMRMVELTLLFCFTRSW